MRYVFGVALVTTVLSIGARADLVTFENVVSPPNITWSSLGSGGYFFTGPQFHALNDHTGLADNGSLVYIGSIGAAGNDHTITMTKMGGGTFDVTSFDGAELFQNGNNLNNFYPNATSIRLTGFFSGGGSITADFQLDGILDGPAGAADFQHFNVVGFTGLSSMKINGIQNGGGEFAFAADNIFVVSIPSPTSARAGALGLVSLGVLRRRR